MDYQEENIPEKMECKEGLCLEEILSEARRKLLKYRRKKWPTEQEEWRERFMVENFQCLDTRYIFQCCKCKSYFIPDDEEIKNPHKRRKTE